jgi:glutamine amidotransferase
VTGSVWAGTTTRRPPAPSAIEQAIGFVEACGARRWVHNPFQGTIATTDGDRTWAVRYSTEGKSRSLYFTTAVPKLRTLYPDDPRMHQFSDDMRVIVSEPLGDLPGVWNEVPESTCSVVTGEDDELRPFHPKAPVMVVPV